MDKLVIRDVEFVRRFSDDGVVMPLLVVGVIIFLFEFSHFGFKSVTDQLTGQKGDFCEENEILGNLVATRRKISSRRDQMNSSFGPDFCFDVSSGCSHHYF